MNRGGKVVISVITLFVLLVSIFFINFVSAQEIDDCGELNTTDTYTLNASVSISGTCFTISAENITLDCNGYNITGDTTGNGIYSDKDYTIIRNCVIDNFENGIYLSTSSNNKLYNNLVNGYYGIELVDTCQSNNITNNNVTASIGISLEVNSDYNIVNNNIITTTGDIGIAIDTSSYNNATYNTVTSVTEGISIYSASNNIVFGNNVSSGTVGILLDASSTYNIIDNNTVQGIYETGSNSNNITNNIVTGSVDTSNGISFDASNNNFVSKNNVTVNDGSLAIYLVDSSYNILTENNANGTETGSGITLELNSSYNNLTSNTGRGCAGIDLVDSVYNILTNNFGIGTNGYGIGLAAADYNTFINNVVTGNVEAGIPIHGSKYNVFMNNNITGVGVPAILSSNWLTSIENSLIYNNTFGEIYFSPLVEDVTGDLIFSGDNIDISNNYAFVNTDALTGLNLSANITLKNLPTNFTRPIILRNGIYCSECVNYTDLNAGIVLFNVLGWSNYSIGEIVDTTPPSTTQPIITPSNPETSDDLECYATLTDNIQTNLVAYWKWYKNGISFLNGNTNVTNGAYSLITPLDSGNTTAGDNWTCEVLPFDGNYGNAVNSSFVEIGWAIIFNVTSGEDGSQISNFNINCNNSFSVSGVSSPYTTGFSSGSYECNFSKGGYYTKIITFISDNDKVINVKLSRENQLTVEEHTWLEAIYNCLYSGDCSLYNLLLGVNQTVNNVTQTINEDHALMEALNNCIVYGDCSLYNTLINVNQTVSSSFILTQALHNCIINGDCTLYNMIIDINNNTINGLQEHTWFQAIYDCTSTGNCTLYNNLYNSLSKINQTVVNIWQRLTGTDRSVILQENITSYYKGPSSNIEIDYTIKIPYKEGVPLSELLPIRLYFWFTNVSRTGCYNQDKASDTNRAEDPYCLPLVAETLGPNNGTKTFKVSLRPNLVTGTYNITRSIEIDPLGVWTQYGREDIGQIEVLGSGDASIEISNENNINSEISSSSSSGSSGTTKVYKNYNNYYITENQEGQQEPQTPDTIYLNEPGITGGTVGTLLSESNLIIIIIIVGSVLITFIISRTILKTKEKK